MKYKNIKYWTLALLMLTSCSDFLEEYSQDMSKVETWEDLNELLLGDGYLPPCIYVANDYSGASQLNKNLNIIHFMGDELIENPEVESSYDWLDYRTDMFSFYIWQQDTGMDEDLEYIGGDEYYWDMLYERINTTNMVLALIDEQPETNDKDKTGKERVKGEASFLRAAYYFILANLYAKPYVPAEASSTPGVPIKTSEFVEDREYTRAPLSEVYKQILSDLDMAEQCLTDKERISVYHADIIATYLLRSRVLLYMQNWKEAANYAQKVLDMQDELLDLHSINVGTNSVSKDSPETIFTMGGYLIAMAFADTKSFGYSYPPSYLVSDDMTSLYNSNDLRGKLYIGESEDMHIYPVFMKFNGQASTIGTYHDVSDCFLMRTPEAYLILAEASAMSGEESIAQETLRKFRRTRMTEDEPITLTGNELINFIRDERAREFILEGHRWFDLRRYSVNTQYPWSKPIEHTHSYYDFSTLLYTDYYRLEEYDMAYTLPIPRSVREFQVSIGNNDRPSRKAYKRETF